MMNWGVASQYFDTLITLDDQAREVQLSKAKLDDETQDLLRRMLAQADRETRFMQSSEERGGSPSLGKSDLVGVWRVDSPLGSGGAGDVYKVIRDDGQYEQVAALKLLHAVSESQQDRFTQERQILARLEHPNLSRLIDGGVSDKGQPYLVMEYVIGQTVMEYAEAHHLSLKDKLRLIGPIASALGHAHSRLVLHRDVKPSNVLITDDGQVKLIDFGVASALTDVPEDLLAPLSRAYAAPEQWAGNPVSAATDIFGLAALTHELLTGIVINRAETETHYLNLPHDIRAILNRALSEDPSQRYQSAQAFAHDIDSYLENRPVAARQGGKAYRLSKFFKRYRAASIATSALMLALIGGVVGTTLMAQKAEHQAQVATRVKTAIVDIFRKADPLELDSALETRAELTDYLIAASDEVRVTLGEDPEVAHEVLNWSITLSDRADEADRSLKLRREALAIERTLFGSTSLEALSTEASILSWEMDQRTKVKPDLDLSQSKALQLKTRLDAFENGDSQLLSEAHLNLGYIFRFLGNSEFALEHFERVWTSQDTPSNSQQSTTIEAETASALIYKNSGDFTKAESLARRALDRTRSVYGDKHLRVVNPLSALATLYNETGRADEGATLLSQAVELQTLADGPESETALRLRNNLAIAYSKTEKFALAQAEYLKIISIRESRDRSAPVDIATAYQNLGVASEGLGEYDKAITAMYKAQNIYAENLPLNSLSRYVPFISIARIETKRKNIEGVLKSVEKARDGISPILNEDHFIFAMLNCFEGEVRVTAGQSTKAIRLLLTQGSAKLKNIPGREKELEACQLALEQLN